MKSCTHCNGTGHWINTEGFTQPICFHCNGTGREGGQEPIADYPAKAAEPAPEPRKFLKEEDVESINNLIHYRRNMIADLLILDGEIASANRGCVGGVELTLKNFNIITTYQTLKHIGLALRAILVQQEIKARRQLLELGVAMPQPSEKEHPYYFNTLLFGELETLASIMRKPFDEK